MAWSYLLQAGSVTNPPMLWDGEKGPTLPPPPPYISQAPFRPLRIIDGTSEVGGSWEKPGHFLPVVLPWVVPPHSSLLIWTGLCGSRPWAPVISCLSASGRSMIPILATL